MRTALTISAVVHALLWVPVVWSGPDPLAKPAEDPIVVDIVSPDQIGEAAPAEMPSKPDATDASAKAQSEAQPAPAPKAAAEAAKSAPDVKRIAARQPLPTPQPPQPAPQPVQAQPVQPQLQGSWLDSALMSPPVAASPFDASESADETAANLAQDEVETFKAHLQRCWNAPAGAADDQHLMVVLRISLKPNGALAGEPALMAASASADGPALMKTAMKALRQCQPYAFLPAGKYKEWKLLDLSFTPAGLSVMPKVLSSASP